MSIKKLLTLISMMFGLQALAPAAFAGVVIGSIDGVVPETTTTPASIWGWACETGDIRPIDVHLYAGGAFALGGTLAECFRSPSGYI